MEDLIKAAQAVLEDFDLYGQPISLALLGELRRCVDAAQQSAKASQREVDREDAK